MKKDKPMSRRDFLKLSGRAGIVLGLGLGLGGGLGSLLAGCRKGDEASSTIATIGDTQTSLTTSTTVSAESGRDLVVGVVSHQSGPAALYGRADEWWTQYAGRVLPQGVLCGDGKLHRVLFMLEDSRSDPVLAARAAERLISAAKVDMLTCSGDASVVNAVADRADALGCPCLTSFHLWQPFVLGRKKRSPQNVAWAYAHAVGLEDLVADYLAMWEQLATNKRVGLAVWDNADSPYWLDASAGLPAAAEKLGYGFVLPGLVTESAQHASNAREFARRGCDICCAVMPPEEFGVFRRECAEVGYAPKVFTAGNSLRFPQVVDALGSRARNLTAEGLWQPDWPFVDSITGASIQALAEDYTASTGEKWASPLAQYAKFEWIVDVFRRVSDIDSREAVIGQVRTTKLDTCVGPIDFAQPVGVAGSVSTRRPAENVCKAAVAGVQWAPRGAFEVRPMVVANEGWLEIPIVGEVQPMSEE